MRSTASRPKQLSDDDSLRATQAAAFPRKGEDRICLPNRVIRRAPAMRGLSSTALPGRVLQQAHWVRSLDA
jgi:hypothetical protein